MHPCFIFTFLQVFGIAPPQILYHTRQSPSPSATTPIGQMPGYTAIGDVMTTAIPNGRNPNRSAYRPKKKNDRPSTSESSKQLLPKSIPSGSCDVRRHPHNSLVYSHYQHSLNSLNDIIDRVRAHWYPHPGCFFSRVCAFRMTGNLWLSSTSI